MKKVWRIVCVKQHINFMTMRILFYLFMIQAGLVFGIYSNVYDQETTDQVNTAMKTADASALSNYFNTTLDISLPDTEQSMSKSQATQVMKNFFKNNPPKSYSVDHIGSSREATKYIIGTYTSGSKTFKTYVLLKETNNKYLIVQLQFEKE